MRLKTIDGFNYYLNIYPHALNFILELNLGSGWQASSVWIFNSGMPYTQIVGYYDKLTFDDLLTTWDKYDPRNPYVILGVSKHWQVAKLSSIGFISYKTILF